VFIFKEQQVMGDGRLFRAHTPNPFSSSTDIRKHILIIGEQRSVNPTKSAVSKSTFRKVRIGSFKKLPSTTSPPWSLANGADHNFNKH
jgi:hypothetical protein